MVDDHPLVREGLKQVLLQIDSDAAIFEAKDATEALQRAEAHPDLDLIFLDLALPSLSGFEVLATLRRTHSDIPVVVISASVDPTDVTRAIRGGAAGFIPKSYGPGVMLGAVRLIMSGGVYLPPDILLAEGMVQGAGNRPAPPGAMQPAPPRLDIAELGLSNRQAQVLARLLQGQSNKAIARELDLAEQTVKAHVSAIFRVLNVTGRTQAVVAVAQLGIDLSRYLNSAPEAHPVQRNRERADGS